MQNRKSPSTATEALFARLPVFSLAQAIESLEPDASDRERVSAGVINRLKHHLRTGRLKRVARQIYAVVPPGADPREFREDAFLVAAAARPDAIFSHHSALELLGASHSVWNEVTVFTALRRPPLALSGATIRFLRHPPALVRRRQSELGARQVFRHGVPLRTTGPERTLVEGFRQPHLVGGVVELVESASGLTVLDHALLVQVLKAYDLRRVWAAVGWFLEGHRETFYADDALLRTLARRRPRAAVYLEPGTRGGTFAAHWNIIAPEAFVAGKGPDER